MLTLLFIALEMTASGTLSASEKGVLTRLTPSASLTDAATCIADAMAQGATLSSSLTRYCAASHGVYDSLLLPVAIIDSEILTATSALADFFDREAGPRKTTHYGAAVRDDISTRLAVVLFTRRVGELYLDTEPAPGRTFVFHGGLGLDYEIPHALLTHPDGSVHDARLIVIGKRDFVGQMQFPKTPGRYQLEILGWSSDLGPVVVANRALFVGTAPEPPEVLETSTADPRERLLVLMNEARSKSGQAPLALDTALQGAAQAHAADMFARGYFGHDSPEDNVVMRLRDAHISDPVLAENLAQATSPEDAHATLMASPGHRKNVLDARLQKVGIGVVSSHLQTGDPCMIVVVDFAGQGRL